MAEDNDEALEQAPGPHTRYNWEAIRETFVEGYMDPDGNIRWLNQKECAEHHGVPYSRFRKHAARYHWTEARAAFQAQREAARRSELAADAAKEMAGIDTRSILIAKTGLTLITTRLQQIARQAAAADANPELDVYAPDVDAREISALAAAAEKYRELAANGLGFATGRTEIELTGTITTPSLRDELTYDDSEDSRVRGLAAALLRSGLADRIALPRGEGGDPDGSDSEAAIG